MYKRRWTYARQTAPAVTTIYPSRTSVRVRSTVPKKRTVNAVTRRRGPYWKASVKKIVQDALSRTCEKKVVNYEPAQTYLYAPTNSGFPTNNVLRLTPGSSGPNLLQGVGQGQRVGNQINVKKLMFNVALSCRAYHAGQNPTPMPWFVRVVLFYERDFPNDVPNPTTNFFQNGNISDAIVGDLGDMINEVNTDLYVKLAERTFKIGFESYPDPTTGVPMPGTANNDFKLSEIVKWDVTKYVPKKMLFSDNGSEPTSRGLFAVFMLAPANGTLMVTTTAPLQLKWTTQLEFTDP